MAHNNKKTFKKVLKVLDLLFIIMQVIFGIAMIPVMIVVTLVLPGVAAWYTGLDYSEVLLPLQAVTQLPALLMSQILPFPWRKCFMKRLSLANYPGKSQAKYYLRCARTEKTVSRMNEAGIGALWNHPELDIQDISILLSDETAKDVFRGLPCEQMADVYVRTHDDRLLDIMSADAISLIWNTTEEKDWRMIILHGWKLNNFQFTAILKNKPQLVREYVRKNTPADWMVLAMAKEGTYAQELQRCAERYGLSPKVIEALTPETLAKLEQPLRCFKQRTFLQRCKTAEGVQHFFELVGDIEVNAQMAMADWQYHLFHQAGHKLCHEFVHDVIRRQDAQWFKLILELEGDGLEFTDQEVAIINSSPELTDTLFRFVVKKKKEETESDGIVL